MTRIAFTLALLAGAAHLLFAGSASAATQTDIVGPAGSGQFGDSVTVLPNGNFVVTDPGYDAPGPIPDVGRVYLYNGATLALINTMTGSAANDLIGSDNSGRGVRVLANGDYVVSSSSWNGTRGAVTRCSASSGCPPTISAANSLVGSAPGNLVGSGGVEPLPNGNYVVLSSSWDSGATNVGAITWCNGASGCTGAVSAENSRVGSTAGDGVGLFNIAVLSNGNYVALNLLWDNGAATDAGAVTFCSGTTACRGPVSVANSLVGTTAGEFTGNNGVFPLSNGNFVVCNAEWDNGAAMNVGAATFCSGTTGCTAAVGPANSLIGTTANDQVGLTGIAVLSNGNYVVRSPFWDNGGKANIGAATFCSGTAGCTATTVSTSNSLFGSTTDDQVSGFGGGGIVALTNGNYVVNSPDWDNAATSEPNAGASTWCSGTTGRTGAVAAGNSLIGPSLGDRVGGLGVALTNGNYVISSSQWNNPSPVAIGAGAVTFCNGTTGCLGEVTSSNSLVGSSNGDNVGLPKALTNGNYVVTAGGWNNGAINDVGAATFCSGTSGCTGPVSPANSLIGTTTGDGVGGSNLLPLAGGSYLVISSYWDNAVTGNAGALTRCSGTSGCTGTVSPANSLVGTREDDFLGATAFGESGALANGDYVVRSSVWDNAGIVDAGAVSYGFGNGGTVGPITAANSVRGTIANGGSLQNFSFGSTNNKLVVGRPAENIVTVFTPDNPNALRITSITRLANGHIVLQGIGVPGAVHTVQRSLTTPAAASLGFLASTTANGSGLIHFTDTTSSGLTKAFYRLTFP